MELLLSTTSRQVLQQSSNETRNHQNTILVLGSDNHHGTRHHGHWQVVRKTGACHWQQLARVKHEAEEIAFYCYMKNIVMNVNRDAVLNQPLPDDSLWIDIFNNGTKLDLSVRSQTYTIFHLKF